MELIQSGQSTGECPKPKLNPSRQRRLTEYEYTFLVKGNYPQETLRNIIEVAIETGMRRGEILGIQTEHIKGQTLLIPITKRTVIHEQYRSLKEPYISWRVLIYLILCLPML